MVCLTGQNGAVWWLISVAIGIVTAWLALIVVLYLRRPNDATIGEALRLLPDTIRLIRHLATDRRVPRSTRIMLWAFGVYLLSPIDLVPDFVPIVGYADDAILLVLILRHVIRSAGPQLIEEHWPGTDSGLSTLHALVGRT